MSRGSDEQARDNGTRMADVVYEAVKVEVEAPLLAKIAELERQLCESHDHGARHEVMARLGQARTDIKQSHRGIDSASLSTAEMKGRQAALARLPEDANPYIKLPLAESHDERFGDLAVAWYAGWRVGWRELTR